jgi:site-specific DNA recombinase
MECLRRLVKRIAVATDCIQLEIRLDAIEAIAAIARNGGCEVDADAARTPRTTTIRLPVELRRCGLGLRLIIPTASVSDRREPDPRLVALLAKAHDWFARLINGDAGGIRSIAQQEKVSSSYVVRVVQLAFLAPEIASAIAHGDHPPTLTARRLIGSVPLALDWNDQRPQLGFARSAVSAG